MPAQAGTSQKKDNLLVRDPDHVGAAKQNKLHFASLSEFF